MFHLSLTRRGLKKMAIRDRAGPKTQQQQQQQQQCLAEMRKALASERLSALRRRVLVGHIALLLHAP